jgi:beta-lactamase class D
MLNWVKRLSYGNQDTSGTLDSFWLNGALRITPLQQVGFLWRLDNGKLAVDPASRATVVDILELERGPGYILRGKTGLLSQPEAPMDLGWFVGWVEQGAHRVYFATVLDGHRSDVKLAPVRISLTKQILRAQKLLP